MTDAPLRQASNSRRLKNSRVTSPCRALMTGVIACGRTSTAYASQLGSMNVSQETDALRALGINPVGQSGVPFDAHYRDQAATYHQGGQVPQHLLEADVQANARSTLRLVPR